MAGARWQRGRPLQAADLYACKHNAAAEDRDGRGGRAASACADNSALLGTKAPSTYTTCSSSARLYGQYRSAAWSSTRFILSFSVQACKGPRRPRVLGTGAVADADETASRSTNNVPDVGCRLLPSACSATQHRRRTDRAGNYTARNTAGAPRSAGRRRSRGGSRLIARVRGTDGERRAPASCCLLRQHRGSRDDPKRGDPGM